jgi:hypothetical protein
MDAMMSICRDQGVAVFAETGMSNICKETLSQVDARHFFKVAPEDILSKGLKDEQYVSAFMSEFGLSIDQSKVIELPGGVPVAISKEFFIDKATRQWKVQQYGREPYVKLLARTIQDPYEIWEVPATVSGRPMPVLRLIRIFQVAENKIGGFVVFNLVSGRYWQAATAFSPKLMSSGAVDEQAMMAYLEKQRQGLLIYREELM